MTGKMLKRIENYQRYGEYWRNMLDKNRAFLRKVMMFITSCNMESFNIYAPVLDAYFI